MMAMMMTEIIRCDVAGHGSQCFFWKVEFRNSNNLLLLLLLSAISMAPLPSSRTPIFTRVGAGSEEKKKKYFFVWRFSLLYFSPFWKMVMVLEHWRPVMTSDDQQPSRGSVKKDTGRVFW